MASKNIQQQYTQVNIQQVILKPTKNLSGLLAIQMLLSCKTVVHIEPFNKIHNNKYYYYISFESLQMYSCGSLAPKMRRGGGCADHLFRRPAEPWEKGDG